MSLVTDQEYLITQLRIQFLHSEDPLAERIITFPQPAPPPGHESNQSLTNYTTNNMMKYEKSYLQEEIEERKLCYSPNITTLVSELQKQHRQYTQQPVQQANKDKVSHKQLPTESQPQQEQQVKTEPLQFFKQEISTNQKEEKKSMLSPFLKQSNQTQNPFAKLFSHVHASEPAQSLQMTFFLPFLKPDAKGQKRQLKCRVRKDASVEEVIGYVLYVCFEEFGYQCLDHLNIDFKVTNFDLRIVEDDGEMDEDFPALERGRKIQKFSFDQFAIIPSQKATSNFLLFLFKERSQDSKSSQSDLQKQNSLSSPQLILLKVHLYSTLEVKQTTTIPVAAQMPFSEVLLLICKKRKLEPNEYCLKMADTKTDIPMGMLVSDLEQKELCLLKKNQGPSAGDIFLRPPEENKEDDYMMTTPLSADEFSLVYKKYLVTRKLTMIGRQERVLAIDGEYIYLMPSTNDKQYSLFDSKTTCYHISSVQSCKLVKKNSLGFKLSFLKDRETKTYEFEASSIQEANEICTKISFLSKMNK